MNSPSMICRWCLLRTPNINATQCLPTVGGSALAIDHAWRTVRAPSEDGTQALAGTAAGWVWSSEMHCSNCEWKSASSWCTISGGLTLACFAGACPQVATSLPHPLLPLVSKTVIGWHGIYILSMQQYSYCQLSLKIVSYRCIVRNSPRGSPIATDITWGK